MCSRTLFNLIEFQILGFIVSKPVGVYLLNCKFPCFSVSETNCVHTCLSKKDFSMLSCIMLSSSDFYVNTSSIRVPKFCYNPLSRYRGEDFERNDDR